jgi:hypothetical protein
MQAPGIYSIESYEPAILRPEEVKQNDLLIRRAYTEKKLPTFNFNLGNIPIMNPSFMNNNINAVNGGFINNKLTHRKNMTNMTIIPISISMKNPFNYNNPIINKNPNKVMNTIQFNNPFLTNKNYKPIKYVIRPATIKKENAYQNGNGNIQLQRVNFQKNLQGVYRNKSPQFVQNYSQFHSLNNDSNIYRNKIIRPYYRRIIYRKKC